ncbi:MAG: hypothetical protein PF482_12120 [Desulfobacteraceae bacterium]|nr:hypothetical protein [Desulfobacteraceae bacterium]
MQRNTKFGLFTKPSNLIFDRLPIADAKKCFPQSRMEIMEKDFQQRMNRTITCVRRIADQRDDDFIPGSIASRISMVWPLTLEVTSLSRYHDVERRLQRNVAVLSRRKR